MQVSLFLLSVITLINIWATGHGSVWRGIHGSGAVHSSTAQERMQQDVESLRKVVRNANRQWDSGLGYDKEAAQAAVWGFVAKYPKSKDAESMVELLFRLPHMYGLADPTKLDGLLEKLKRLPSQPMRDLIAGKERLLAISHNPWELRFKTLDGSDFDLAQHRGKIVFVDVWSPG